MLLMLPLCRHRKEVGGRVDFPGDDGERRSRKSIAPELLEGVLKNVVAGERFDVWPLSDEDSALATMRSIIGSTLFAFCSLTSNGARQDLLVVRGED